MKKYSEFIIKKLKSNKSKQSNSKDELFRTKSLEEEGSNYSQISMQCFLKVVDFCCLLEHASEDQFDEIIDNNSKLLHNQSILQTAIDHCLKIKSHYCTEFPVLDIRTLSRVIKGCTNYEDSVSFKISSPLSSKKLAKSNRKRKFEIKPPSPQLLSDCPKILKLILQNSCVLKYADQYENIHDILRLYYKEMDSESQESTSDGILSDDLNIGFMPKEETKTPAKRKSSEFYTEEMAEENKFTDLNSVFNLNQARASNKPRLKFRDKQAIKRMGTMKRQKIKNILSNSHFLQGLKSFDLHILNMKESKTKYLQEKDIIEIAVIICFFTPEQICELCSLIFFWKGPELSSLDTRFPLSLYKLLLFYEELEAFQLLYSKESNDRLKKIIILKSFSYSLLISNPLIAIYLRNIYPDELYSNKSECIDAILTYLNEFTELNGSTIYRRVKHLEQYLYIIERMISYFSFQQGKYLLNIFETLIDVGEIDLSRILKAQGLKKINHDCIDKYENNFIVYSSAPMKECAMIIYICKLLEGFYEQLKHPTLNVVEVYSNMVVKILDNTQALSQVYTMLTDKCFNRKEVVDILSICDLQTILNHEQVARVVTDFWDGPYEKEFFMNQSTVYREVYGMFIGRKKFLDFHPDNQYKYSIVCSCKKKMSPKERKMLKSSPKKAHFFHFNCWDRSLITKYTVEAIFILWTSYVLYTDISTVLHHSVDNDKYIVQAGQNRDNYDGATNQQIREELDQEYDQIQANQEEQLKILYQQMTSILFSGWCLTMYLLKNIHQYIFLKLTYKNSILLITEVILGIIFSIFLVRFTVYFLIIQPMKVDINEKYYYTKTFYHINSIDDFSGASMTFSVIVCVQLIRAFQVLKASRTFGPMVQILVYMINQICIFLVLEATLSLIFVFTFRILFFSIPEFQSFRTTSLTLLSASMNQFDLEIFKNSSFRLNPWIGYLMTILYIVVSGIILLNFLIAIISNVYNKLTKISMGMYLRTLIDIRQGLHNNEHYSCLVSGVTPCNLLVLVFLPCILWCRGRKINNVILHLEYLVVLGMGCYLFALIQFFLFPISYLAILVNFFRDFCYYRRKKKSRIVILVDLIIFLLFGVLILTVQCFIDFWHFLFDLYTDKLIGKYDNEKIGHQELDQGYIDPEFYDLFLKMLEKYDTPHVSSKKVVRDLGEVLDLYSQLRKLIFYVPQSGGTSEFKNVKSDDEMEMLRKSILRTKTPEYVLRQYNVLKLIINNCSIPNKITRQNQYMVKNLKKVQGDQIFCRKLSIMRLESTNDKDLELESITDRTFYISEFLDMARDLQQKEIFSEIIYANKFDRDFARICTKRGRKYQSSLMKSLKNTNLQLVNSKYRPKAPSYKQLIGLNPAKNYTALSQYKNQQ
ncbi:unnamed protein product [Moneuplotes crassus]|uniref:Ion transport domain-containing protein n=1 Tax=Euplotes crassus TaxID=5936 RepID=A0AAD1Y7U9_EUPCR|nr:unnamed protein product [Moneuplotes crassus]